jgi:hypothetical protein
MALEIISQDGYSADSSRPEMVANIGVLCLNSIRAQPTQHRKKVAR